MKNIFYILLILTILSSCSPRIISPLSESEKLKYQTVEQLEMESITNYLEGIVEAGINKKREKYVYNKLMEIDTNVTKERIDIYSFQHNYILEIKGETDKIIYLTAHYDKTDANIFKLISVCLNGLLDEPISWSYLTQGAIDNGTGVATAIQLANKLSQRKNYYTYRILLTGSEESGIRGARSHVARIKMEEWNKVQCCINIDCIGVKDERFGIVNAKNDPHLTRLSIETAKENNLDLVLINNVSGVSDNAPFNKTSTATDFGRSFMFNLPGAFLPQRSYFTKPKSVPTLFFSSTAITKFHILDFFNFYLPIAIPSGNYHNYSDNLFKLDQVKLYEGYSLINGLLLKIEEQRLY